MLGMGLHKIFINLAWKNALLTNYWKRGSKIPHNRPYKEEFQAKIKGQSATERSSREHYTCKCVDENEGEKRKYVDIQGASVTGATVQGGNIGGGLYNLVESRNQSILPI